MLLDRVEAEDEVSRRRDQVRGHLRVTMSPWILYRFILLHLRAVRRDHPGLTIEFLSVDRFAHLVDEGQDCAILVGQFTDSALISTRLADNVLIICAAPRFLAETSTPQQFTDLEQAP